MMAITRHLAVAAVVRRTGTLLMVCQRMADGPEVGWTLPGGACEDGELFTEALARELGEETGLSLRDASLGYLVQLHRLGDGELWTVAVLEATVEDGLLAPSDPAFEVLEAAFVPLPEAIDRLDSLRHRVIGEPAAGYLRNHGRGPMLWQYRESADGVERVGDASTAVACDG
jgi:8-oxo-dGTP diphosphatase